MNLSGCSSLQPHPRYHPEQTVAVSLKLGILCSAIAAMSPCSSSWKKPLYEAGKLLCFFPALHQTTTLADLLFLQPTRPFLSYASSAFALVTVVHSLMGNTSTPLDRCCRHITGVVFPVFALYRTSSAIYRQEIGYTNPQSLAHIAYILGSSLELYTYIQPRSPHSDFLIGGCKIAAALLSPHSAVDSAPRWGVVNA